ELESEIEEAHLKDEVDDIEPQFIAEELQEDNLDEESTRIPFSQAEQGLVNPLSEDKDLGSLEDALDDKLLIEDDFSEQEAEEASLDSEIEAFESPDIEDDTKPLNFDEVQETLESELPFTPEE
ncbi:hypothetical protein, partial [Pseudoalteromonas sp. BSi20652]|uniref:hypothetical protein n=1 Tax=Pseudoalteromonas sp. BSi20652 TaxID=388384 RepID=UPI00051940FF